jgi:predicted GNAT family acetyltransferase
LGKFHPGADTLAQFVPERTTAQYALHPDKWESTFYSLTNKDSDKLKYYGPKKISIPPGTLVGDMAIANKFYRAKTTEEKQQYAELYKQSLKPYPVDVSEYRMPELLIPMQDVAKDNALTEIEHMKQSHFTGGKDMLGSFQKPGKKHLKPLPGGTDLMYSVTKDNYGSYVYIVDPGVPGITKNSIVASLSLVDSNLPNTFQVGTITVDEDYRGRGLARALYGIVLTIMRKNLVSGSSQTPGGRRNWLSLASIPGVEVKGLVYLRNRDTDTTVGDPKSRYNKYVEKTIDRVMELGGQFVSKEKNYNYWAFDVVPGKGQLQPAVQNALSKLYGYDSDALLMATWTGA